MDAAATPCHISNQCQKMLGYTHLYVHSLRLCVSQGSGTYSPEYIPVRVLVLAAGSAHICGSKQRKSSHSPWLYGYAECRILHAQLWIHIVTDGANNAYGIMRAVLHLHDTSNSSDYSKLTCFRLSLCCLTNRINSSMRACWELQNLCLCRIKSCTHQTL